SQQESSPLSGRKSTQATVRICGASSPHQKQSETVGVAQQPQRNIAEALGVLVGDLALRVNCGWLCAKQAKWSPVL
ncbi:hypothetical protein, partial [Bradyrhizobium diazoefficiens]|uniref:hypothetical protein n=1 Tax=Bradyrhizobium diazoefficiens TaxID=1355477 RepID=UPI001B8BE788